MTCQNVFIRIISKLIQLVVLFAPFCNAEIWVIEYVEDKKEYRMYKFDFYKDHTKMDDLAAKLEKSELKGAIFRPIGEGFDSQLVWVFNWLHTPFTDENCEQLEYSGGRLKISGGNDLSHINSPTLGNLIVSIGTGGFVQSKEIKINALNKVYISDKYLFFDSEGDIENKQAKVLTNSQAPTRQSKTL